MPVNWEAIRQAALTLAQLLKFNSVKHTHKTEECTQHDKSQETPLPVHIGVMFHMKHARGIL